MRVDKNMTDAELVAPENDKLCFFSLQEYNSLHFLEPSCRVLLSGTICADILPCLMIAHRYREPAIVSPDDAHIGSYGTAEAHRCVLTTYQRLGLTKFRSLHLKHDYSCH